MRLIFWALGSLLASLSILAFAFSSFSYMAVGRWSFMSSNQIWLRLGLGSGLNGDLNGDQSGGLNGGLIGGEGGQDVAMTLSQTIMALLPNSELLGLVDRFLISPIFDMGFVFLVGVLGAFFLYIGRYREPDYF